MKLPGQALLEFRLDPIGEGGTELVCIARFLPRGIAGLAYWFSVFPLHKYVFQGMLQNMAEAAGCTITIPPNDSNPQVELPADFDHGNSLIDFLQALEHHSNKIGRLFGKILMAG